MLRAALVALLLLVCGSNVSQAQMTLLGTTNSRVYVGPGDVVAFTAWYGLRAYSRAKCTGSVRALTIRRASDATTQNINILSNCELDNSAISTFCNATTCSVAEICDQVNASDCTATHDLVQATAANQPTVTANCIGSRYCMVGVNTSNIRLTSANNFTPATGLAFIYSVNARQAGTGACSTIMGETAANFTDINSGGSEDRRIVGGGGGSVSVNMTAAGTNFVAAAGLMNGASSYMVANGTRATGTATGNTTATPPRMIIGNASTTCATTEGGFIDNVAITADVAQMLNSTARGYWGF